MLKVGLTGGIGCGKSTAIDAFITLGVKIIDADQIARDIVQKGTDGLAEIAKQFGDNILLDNGELDRARLKKIIFAETKAGKKALSDLEKITHPKIRAEIESQISQASAEKSAENPYIIVDIPLLVEKNYQSMFDRIVVVDCTEEQQIKRVHKRDELDESIIKKIIQQQATREQRKKAATDILDNSKDIDNLLSQVNCLHQQFVSLSQE